MNTPYLWRELSLCLLLLVLMAESSIVRAQMDEFPWRDPLTIDKAGGDAVKPWWIEPKPVNLPSKTELETIVVKGRTYNIVQVAKGSTYHAPKETQAVQIKATADAAVSQAKPTENFGKWGRNPVRGDKDNGWSYLLRFDLPESTKSPWAKAELAIKVHTLDAKQPTTMVLLPLAGTPWEEATVNWETKPATLSQTPIAYATASKAEQMVSFDLTDYLKQLPPQAKLIELMVVTDDGKQITLQSKELSGGMAPTLRVWTQAALESAAQLPPPPDPLASRALYEIEAETLFFKGSGRGGRESKERLIVEDCTFVVDFQHGDFKKWDALRSAIYVEGYKEVIIRRSNFISKGKFGDPPRKTNASFTAYDCVNVLVEDCKFEGMTNWMRGHVLVYCCGPTTIRRVEVTGTKQETKDKNGKLREVYASGGGIWVANGLGEGKIGTFHANDPDLRMYPSGPLVIEDCHVHHQTGRDNNDAIYIQSIHPFLVRNCKVEHWKTDTLMDLGFRDSLGKGIANAKLANHGAMGLVENCTFAGGFIKVSVGAGGGIVMRNNVLDDVYLMPYAFDGGHWYVLNNRFEKVNGPLITGKDGRTNGWAPKEGMFMRGSQMVWRNNSITFAKEKPVENLVVLNPNGPKEYPPVNADDPRISVSKDDAPLQLLPQPLQYQPQ